MLVPVVLAAALLASPGAFAFNACLQEFTNTYPASQSDDALGADACLLCHTTSFSFNPYGAVLAASGTGCTSAAFADVLASVESLDSDHSGDVPVHSNIDEINAGTQPGWCVTGTTGCNNSGTPPANIALDPEPPAPTNNPPVADAGGPYSGEAGTTLIQFDGSGSMDPDDNAITFEWEFGDGSTATEEMPTHTYRSAGNYEVRLVVDDGQVKSEPSITSAVISAPPANIAPVANPGGPYTGAPGQMITFDGSASEDPNGDALTYSWNFGDGSSGSGVNPTHTYAAAGNYTVTLTVSDSQLESAPVTTTAEIAIPPANRAPVADPGGPYSGETGAEIRFDGSASDRKSTRLNSSHWITSRMPSSA